MIQTQLGRAHVPSPLIPPCIPVSPERGQLVQPERAGAPHRGGVLLLGCLQRIPAGGEAVSMDCKPLPPSRASKSCRFWLDTQDLFCTLQSTSTRTQALAQTWWRVACTTYPPPASLFFPSGHHREHLLPARAADRLPPREPAQHTGRSTAKLVQLLHPVHRDARPVPGLAAHVRAARRRVAELVPLHLLPAVPHLLLQHRCACQRRQHGSRGRVMWVAGWLAGSYMLLC